MELSGRLKQIADLVTKGAFVADIGTDHAFVPVYLVQQGICNKALAMDINKGPLERAKIHISGYQLEDRIETRLSDGMEALKKDEVDLVIIAGMGGPLMIKILTDYPEKTASISEFILQPQSEIPKFRQFLIEHDFIIENEEIIFEDGKYYPMMKVKHGVQKPYNQIEYKYGKHLLEKKSTVLRDSIEKEVKQLHSVLSHLKNSGSKKTEERCRELEMELALAVEALKVF